MSDETDTQQIAKSDISQKARDESKLFGVSVRAWIVLIVISTVCGMEIYKIGISEPLYTMSTIIVGFYFGQKTTTPPKT